MDLGGTSKHMLELHEFICALFIFICVKIVITVVSEGNILSRMTEGSWNIWTEVIEKVTLFICIYLYIFQVRYFRKLFVKISNRVSCPRIFVTLPFNPIHTQIYVYNIYNFIENICIIYIYIHTFSNICWAHIHYGVDFALWLRSQTDNWLNKQLSDNCRYLEDIRIVNLKDFDDIANSTPWWICAQQIFKNVSIKLDIYIR